MDTKENFPLYVRFRVFAGTDKSRKGQPSSRRGVVPAGESNCTKQIRKRKDK